MSYWILWTKLYWYLKIKKQIDGKIGIISKCLVCDFIKYFSIDECKLNDLLNTKEWKHYVWDIRKLIRTKRNRLEIISKCSVCGKRKARFIKIKQPVDYIELKALKSSKPMCSLKFVYNHPLRFCIQPDNGAFYFFICC